MPMKLQQRAHAAAESGRAVDREDTASECVPNAGCQRHAG